MAALNPAPVTQVDLARRSGDGTLRRALVRHVDDVDPGHDVKEFAGKLQRTADPVGSIVEFAGLLLCECDQLFNVARRHRRMDHKHERLDQYQRHCGEITIEVVGNFCAKRRGNRAR